MSHQHPVIDSGEEKIVERLRGVGADDDEDGSAIAEAASPYHC
jgi:hypothetical protein